MILRTIIYIDGLNLYHRALKNTSYKWLDIHALSSALLPDKCEITQIKYFTTRVKSLPHDPKAPERQNVYIRALENHISCLDIIFGSFSKRNTWMQTPTPPHDRVKVIKIEEKGSDVNLSVHLLNDAWLDKYDCAVLISNDSDMVESLKLVRENHKEKIIYLLNPNQGKASDKLIKHAHSVIPVRQWVLEQSQLPNVIPNTNIRKPNEW